MSDSEFSDVEEEATESPAVGEREAWSDEEEDPTPRVERAASSDEEIIIDSTVPENEEKSEQIDAGLRAASDDEVGGTIVNTEDATRNPEESAPSSEAKESGTDETVSPLETGNPIISSEVDLDSNPISLDQQDSEGLDLDERSDENKQDDVEGREVERGEAEMTEEDEEEAAAAAAAALLEEQAKLKSPEKLHSLVLEGLGTKTELLAVRERFKAKAESGKGGSVGPQVPTSCTRRRSDDSSTLSPASPK
jgi:hypothetical protein